MESSDEEDDMLTIKRKDHEIQEDDGKIINLVNIGTNFYLNIVSNFYLNIVTNFYLNIVSHF